MKTLTIYFEGTSNPLWMLVTQIGLFAEITYGLDLKPLSPAVPAAPDQRKGLSYDPLTSDAYHIAFDGCGVTNGLGGVIFANGLWSQCEEVVSHIQFILASLGDTTHSERRGAMSASPSLSSSELPISLVVNIVGLSRGGIAVLYLVQLIHKRISDINKLQINLLLFDPVPGNLIWSSRYLDLCSFTTANSALDISSCGHIHDVLALYPYQPLPDLAFHAPLFPKYPLSCHEVIEDACLGCHQGALFCQPYPECRLSFARIHDWLESHGTKFDGSKRQNIVNRLRTSPTECIEIMEAEMVSVSGEEQEVRYGHSKPPGVTIRRHPAGSAGHLNRWHRELIHQRDGKVVVASGQQHEYQLEICR
jgi:hypothetical protein